MPAENQILLQGNTSAKIELLIRRNEKSKFCCSSWGFQWWMNWQSLFEVFLNVSQISSRPSMTLLLHEKAFEGILHCWCLTSFVFSRIPEHLTKIFLISPATFFIVDIVRISIFIDPSTPLIYLILAPCSFYHCTETYNCQKHRLIWKMIVGVLLGWNRSKTQNYLTGTITVTGILNSGPWPGWATSYAHT